LSWLGGSVVFETYLEGVSPDDTNTPPVLLVHAAVVPVIEHADTDIENPANTIAVTIAERSGRFGRRTVASPLAARFSANLTSMLTSAPS
jgi:hypothetical protein